MEAKDTKPCGSFPWLSFGDPDGRKQGDAEDENSFWPLESRCIHVATESRCISRDTEPCLFRDAPTPHALPSLRENNSCDSLETDTQTDMLLGEPKSAICVQIFDDSLNSAIHTTYRTWLRSSSMHEPRDPPLKVVSFFFFLYVVKQRRTFSSSSVQRKHNERGWSSARTTQRHLKAQVYPTVRLVKVHST